MSNNWDDLTHKDLCDRYAKWTKPSDKLLQIISMAQIDVWLENNTNGLQYKCYRPSDVLAVYMELQTKLQDLVDRLIDARLWPVVGMDKIQNK